MQKAIPWTSAIEDIHGNTLSYSGDETSITTEAVKIDVNTNGKLIHSDVLKATEYSNENDPHDLSMFNGTRSTANCYVVQGCGWFKLPLVYGNGITKDVIAGKGNDAASNTFGYDKSSSFMNHKGTAIYNLPKAPYICGNGYDPNTAEVVWQSIDGLITDASIDGNYLKFYVVPDKVAQANAVIAVKSGENIVWSWHLWFTASSWTATYTYGSYNFMTMPLGFIDSSDSSPATPRTLQFEFTQDISSGKNTTVSVSQNGGASTGGTCTFYQWGRKDPFPGATADDQTTDNIEPQTDYYSSILNPGKFIKGSKESPYFSNWLSYDYENLWNIGNSSTSKKTIYDPSPVGFKVPLTIALKDIGLSNNNWNSEPGNCGIWVPTTGDFWRAFGMRKWEDGSSVSVGSEEGFYWSCRPYYYTTTRGGFYLSLSSSSVSWTNVKGRASGCPVRPVSE